MAVDKILLIVPPISQYGASPYPPIGFGYITALLKQNGYANVVIHDALERGWLEERDLVFDGHQVGSYDEIVSEVKNVDPDLVGIQCNFTCQYKHALKTAQHIKAVDPRIKTVLGGHHASVSQARLLQDPNVDFVIAGEGEYPMVALCNALSGKQDISEVPSLSHRDSDGKPLINKKTYSITDLDAVPFPDYHAMNLPRYWKHGKCHGSVRKERFAPVVSSRGCPAKCAFCTYSMTPNRYRARSARNVIDEIKLLKREFGIQEITFEDDNLTLKMKRAEEIFDLMIKEDLDVIWGTPNGVAVYALNDSLLEKMRATGCDSLNLAIESGNEDVLRNVIHKPLKLKQAEHVIKKCRQLGIKPFGYFLVGTPGETIEQAWDTFRFAARNFAPEEFRVAFCVPLPGSVAFEICVQNGYLPQDVDMETMNLVSGPIFSTKEMSKEDAVKLMRDGMAYVYRTYAIRKFPMSLFNYSLLRAVSYLYFPEGVVKMMIFLKAKFRKAQFRYRQVS